MATRGTNNRRTITVGLLGAAVLIALVLATGGGFSTSSTPQGAPTPSHEQKSATGGIVHGAVTASVRHLTAHAYSFVYTVHNRGKVTIAGFQINGARANLFHIRGPAGWVDFGTGVCGGKYPNVLIYWSTGQGGIPSGGSARFSFMVNTSGPAQLLYSLSGGTSPPLYGTVNGPRPSSLPASVGCARIG